MSLTVFLALCVLGVDFLIYFFFKLVYGEKHRSRPRRLPPDYYRSSTQSNKIQQERMQTSPLYLVHARKAPRAEAGRVIPMRRPGLKENPLDPGPRSESSELLAYRRIASSLAQTKPRI